MSEDQGLEEEATAGLRQHVRLAVAERFDEFLAELPGSLLGKAGSNLDERTRNEVGRLARVKARDWSERFVAHIDRRLLGTISSEGEERQAQDAHMIAMAKALLIAETRYFKLITELDARLNRLRLMLEVPIYASGMAPVSLYQALEKTADQIGWPKRAQRPLFECFDALFICHLQPVYEQLLAEIKRISAVVAERAAREAPPRPAPRRDPPRPAAERMQPPEDQSHVDRHTEAMLKQFAVDSDGEGYTDGLLAADLLALMDHRPLPGITQDQSAVSLQRMSLAGHYLNEVTIDPLVPAELRPEHESLRLPLVKSALVDSSVFTAESHPLRSMIDELTRRAQIEGALRGVAWRAEARRLQRAERNLVTWSDAITMVCDRDRLELVRLEDAAQARAIVTPLAVPLAKEPAECCPASGRRLVFTGNLGYFVNEHAILSFLERVWPLLRLRRSDLELIVAGARPGRILDLAQAAFGDAYTLETLKRWLSVFFRRFFTHQFKRSCTADAPKVGMVALSPRGDWRMPSDAQVKSWLDAVEAYGR